MTFQDAIDLVKRERSEQERQYGRHNRALSYLEWVGLFGQRLGYAIQAAAGQQRSWFAEECVKMSATCIAALESLPEMEGMSLDADGIAEVAHADSPRARIVAKVMEPPSGSVHVATCAKRVWIGGGNVWVEK
jgi:hypothetical protein